MDLDPPCVEYSTCYVTVGHIVSIGISLQEASIQMGCTVDMSFREGNLPSLALTRFLLCSCRFLFFDRSTRSPMTRLNLADLAHAIRLQCQITSQTTSDHLNMNIDYLRFAANLLASEDP